MSEISNIQSVNKFSSLTFKPMEVYVLWPYPRIMANDSSLEKYAAPGRTVTVSFPVEYI